MIAVTAEEADRRDAPDAAGMEKLPKKPVTIAKGAEPFRVPAAMLLAK